MINPFEDINWMPKECDLNSFAKTLFIGSWCMAFILFFYLSLSSCLLDALALPLYIIIIGTAIFFIANINIKFVILFYYTWYFIGASLGIIISNALLMFFYYFIFSPFSILVKVFTGRDPLKLKKSNDSNWSDVKKISSLNRYFKQY